MKVAGRIWSGIAIILAGYVLTVGLGTYLTTTSALRLDAARSLAIPDTFAMYDQCAVYRQIRDLYQSAVVDGEPAHLTKADPLLDGLVKRIKEIAGQRWLTEARRMRLTAVAQHLQSVHDEAKPVYNKLARNESDDSLQAKSRDLNDRVTANATELDNCLAGVRDDLGDVLQDVAATTRFQRLANLLGMLVVLFISAFAVTWVIRRFVTHPLRQLGSHLGDIANGNGDLTRRIPVVLQAGRAPDDEVTALAVTFNRFLDNLQQLIRKVGETTGRVSGASGQLDRLSQQVAGDAIATRSNVQTGAVASQEVSADMQMVGASVEEMVNSIREISSNAQTAARTASDAVGQARTAGITIGRLSTSSVAIGEVLGLIEKIASQTNLLALNATIEAARAGDAGRGFAVVANEVKDLARQTTAATADIQKRIGAIQADSTSAMDAISRINQVIDAISQANVSIAGAVEEQTATTQHMSELVNGAVIKVSQISGSAATMTASVDSTAECARQTEVAARGLATSATELTVLVGEFKY